jgi:RHS repeat-associated protein
LQDDLYALRDASLNVIALTDASGSVQQRARYAAFGKAEFLTSAWLDASNTYDWNVLFHGHYFDGETGFGQMRYRYYHSTLGRWLSRDPNEGGDGMYIYEFCRNNPLIYIDRLGLAEDQTDPFSPDPYWPQPPVTPAFPEPEGGEWVWQIRGYRAICRYEQKPKAGKYCVVCGVDAGEAVHKVRIAAIEMARKVAKANAAKHPNCEFDGFVDDCEVKTLYRLVFLPGPWRMA